jgi:hypothetical protein
MLFSLACGQSDQQGDPDPGNPDAVTGDTGWQEADSTVPDATDTEDTVQDIQGPDQSEVEPGDPGDDTAVDVVVVPAAFLKGPLLQQVTNSSLRVLIETDVAPVEATVRLGPAGGGLEPATEVDFQVREFEFDMAPPLETWVATAALDDLDPDTRYDYCVSIGTDTRCGAFRTAPDPQTSTAFEFVAFGDTRTNHDDHRMVIQAILDEDADLRFALHTGDFGSIGAELADWQTFFEIEAPLLLNLPFYGVPGNHENMLWGLDYYGAFTDLPRDGMTYSFVYGNAAFIALNTEIDLTTGPEFVWLQNELTRFADDGYHLFVMGHQPIYTFSNHQPYWGGMEHLAPLFEEHGVVAVFAGHNHCYEHFLAGGVHYFTLGGGGAPLYGVDSNIVDELLYLRVMAEKVYNHAIISVDGDRIEMTVRNDSSGDILEEIVLRPVP